MGFEGKIGICMTRRGRAVGLQEQHVQRFGQVVRRQASDWSVAVRQKPNAFRVSFSCTLDLSFLLETVFSVSGAMFLFLKVVGLELSLSFAFSSLSESPWHKHTWTATPPTPHCCWLFDRNFFIKFSQPYSDLQEMEVCGSSQWFWETSAPFAGSALWS